MTSVNWRRRSRASRNLSSTAYATDRRGSGLAAHMVGDRTAHEAVAIQTKTAPTVAARTIVSHGSGVARLAGRGFRGKAGRVRQGRAIGSPARYGPRLRTASARSAARTPSSGYPDVCGTRSRNHSLSRGASGRGRRGVRYRLAVDKGSRRRRRRGIPYQTESRTGSSGGIISCYRNRSGRRGKGRNLDERGGPRFSR